MEYYGFIKRESKSGKERKMEREREKKREKEREDGRRIKTWRHGELHTCSERKNERF